MLITLQLDTSNPADLQLIQRFGGIAGLPGGPAQAPVAPTEPEPAKPKRGRGPQVEQPIAEPPPPTAEQLPAEPAPEPEPEPQPTPQPTVQVQTQSGPDQVTLIKELKDAMNLLAANSSPLEAAKFMREELKFPTLVAIPPAQRQGILEQLKARAEAAMTGVG